jgi:ketosteroid isomerase-like protein
VRLDGETTVTVEQGAQTSGTEHSGSSSPGVVALRRFGRIGSFPDVGCGSRAHRGAMNEHIDLINRYYAAVNERRFDDYDKLFAVDATLEGPGGITGTGPDAMRAFDRVWTNAASDFTVTPLVQLAVDGKVSSENVVEGTHDGLLELPTGDLPATGRTFGGRYVGTFVVAGGRIVSQHVYYDRMIVVDQLMSAPVR